MRQATFSFSIAPSYKGRTIGAIDACGSPPVPSLRQESSAQFGAIGAIGPGGRFPLPFLAVNHRRVARAGGEQ